MAAKSIINFLPVRPETFKRKASIPVAGGKPFEIEFEFYNLTRRQEAKMRDEVIAAKPATTIGAETTWESIADTGILQDSSFFLRMVKGWNVDAPLNAASLDQLLDECRGAGEAINKAFNEGSRGVEAGN